MYYLHLFKAFDKVDHGILCHKLNNLERSGKYCIWIVGKQPAKNMLHDFTTIKSHKQGTQKNIQGLISFIFLIRDIDNNIEHIAGWYRP